MWKKQKLLYKLSVHIRRDQDKTILLLSYPILKTVEFHLIFLAEQKLEDGAYCNKRIPVLISCGIYIHTGNKKYNKTNEFPIKF